MFKKITSIVLALAMVVTLITVTPTQADAALKLLYGKKLTMTVGEKDELAVNTSGVTYTSSDKKVATVNKKGKIKTKGPGICTITVKKGSESVKSKITVKPGPVEDGDKVSNPVKVKAALTNLDSNQIEVTWKPQKSVTGYEVFYSTSKNSGFKKMTVKGAKKSSAVIKNLEYGKKYYIKVRAYKKAGKKTLTGKFSKITKFNTVNTWSLAWSDEFNSTSLNTNVWSFQTGGGGFGNKELQTYTDTNYAMDGSNLIIKPQFQWNTATNSAISGSYTSSKLWTKNADETGYNFTTTYGRVEFRVKLPKAQGTWAAAWMLGVNNVWPLCGEIDILETTSQLEKTRIPQSIHCRKFNGMTGNQPNKHYDSTVSDATSAFHTFGILWTEEMIQFTIDGKVTGTYDPDKLTTITPALSDTTVWPFNQPFYLILNCAIGGVLGGAPGTYGWTEIARNGSTVTYEDYYYIDWVRVYH